MERRTKKPANRAMKTAATGKTQAIRLKPDLGGGGDDGLSIAFSEEVEDFLAGGAFSQHIPHHLAHLAGQGAPGPGQWSRRGRPDT